MGVIVVITICVGPIIKLAILMGMYYLASAICQPIADEKIVKLLEEWEILLNAFSHNVQCVSNANCRYYSGTENYK